MNAKPVLRRRPMVAALILLISAAVYYWVCQPAIHRRGYPPLDPFWMAMSWIWPIGIILSAAFDRRLKRPSLGLVEPIAVRAAVPLGGPPVLDYEARARRRISFAPPRLWQLVAYAIITAFIDAATTGGMVPRHFKLLDVVLLTLFPGAPIHLLVTFVIEWIAQHSWDALRQLQERFEPVERSAGARVSIALALLGFAALRFPFTFADWSHYVDNRAGINSAERDWAAHDAKLFLSDEAKLAFFDHFVVEYYREPSSGLELRSNMRMGFEEAYNARVNHKLRADPHPAWAAEHVPPTDQQMIEMLKATEMKPLTTFPAEINDNTVVVTSGSFTRWGSTFGVGQGPAIATRSGLFGGANATPVFVGHLKALPKIVFIRFGNSIVYAVAEDGTVLSALTKP